MNMRGIHWKSMRGKLH